MLKMKFLGSSVLVIKKKKKKKHSEIERCNVKKRSSQIKESV